ncbi:MAG: branched-chain amino acid ABC transporter permease [Pseudomonadota bacterium]
MESVIFSIFNGLLYGMLLFMLSSGLTLIFSMMGVLNFAHAAFFMLGAYFAYYIMGYVVTALTDLFGLAGMAAQSAELFGFLLAFIVAPLMVGVLGGLVQRYGLRFVHRFGHVAELLFTFGLFLLLEELVQMFFGRVPKNYQIPELLKFAAFTWRGLDYSAYRLFMLVVSVGIFTALFLFLTRTRVGLIIRAALTHPHTVGQLGHNVPRVFMGVFGFGCALAGLAGVIGGNVLGTEPAMAVQLGPIVFVIIVIGGLGSLGGALIASLFIGILDNLAISLDIKLAGFFALFGIDPATAEGIAKDLVTLSSAKLAPVLPYLLLVLVLILRPRGLFGTRDV